MPRTIKPKDVQEFVWNVAGMLEEYVWKVTATAGKDEERYTSGVLLHRFSVALLGNGALFEFLDAGVSSMEVAAYIESVIKACEYIPPRERDNARYIKALLSNPNLHKMLFGREGMVMKA